MGKVYRQDRKSVQRIKARDLVPGDIVEVAGENFYFLHNNGFSKAVWVLLPYFELLSNLN